MIEEVLPDPIAEVDVQRSLTSFGLLASKKLKRLKERGLIQRLRSMKIVPELQTFQILMIF
jgi:hypothetical protein